MSRNTLNTVGLTALRIVTGFIFAAHGWQKFFEWGVEGTQAGFVDMGIPLAAVSGPLVATLELVGGIALMLGILSRPVAALLTIDMLVALVLVHLPFGIFVGDNGIELVLILGAASAAIALAGPGRVSLDQPIFAKRDSKLALMA